MKVMSFVLDPRGEQTIPDSRFSVFDSPPGLRITGDGGDDDPSPAIGEVPVSTVSSSSTSSIGNNSDVSGRSSDDADSGEAEVQSSYNGSLESISALEQVLPIRRGISNFYNGKSKSYSMLGEGFSSMEAKEIAKPENAYSKRRRNLLAFSLVWDKNRNSSLRGNGGAISKRPIRPSKSTLAFAVAMGSSESISDVCTDSSSSLYSMSPQCRPPMYLQMGVTNEMAIAFSPHQHLTPWRSLSLADLQHCANAAKN